MHTTLLFPIATLLSTAALADDARRPKVLEDVAQCRSIEDPAARLACYDKAAPALAEATDKRTIIVLDKSEVQRTRRSLFGFSLPRLPFFGNDRDDEQDEKVVVRELATTITGVRASGYGLWSLTLAEGGTWRTTEPSRTLDPRIGDKILIKRGPVGGYMGTVGKARQIRLQRVG